MPYYLRNLIILSFTIFLAAVSWNQIVPFLPLYLKELGVKENLAQWSGFVFAMQSTAGIIMQPLWGSLGDKYGRKAMILRAGFALVAIYALMSICTNPWQLAALRFLNGALTGFIPGSFTLIATNTPVEYAARYVAIAQTASATGGILGPALGGFLAQFMGYRGSMRLSSIAVLVAVVIVIFLVKEPNKASSPKRPNLVEDFRTAFSNRIMSTVMVITFFSWAIGAAIQPVLSLYLEGLPGSSFGWLGGIVFSLPGIAFILAGYRWSRFGEGVTYARVIVIGLVGSGISMAALSVMANLFQFSAGYFAMGIFAAALGPCSSAIIATRIDESFRGRAYGMQQSAGTFGGLVAPIAAGAVGGWLGIKWVFVFVGLATLLGAALVNAQAKKWPMGATGEADDAPTTTECPADGG